MSMEDTTLLTDTTDTERGLLRLSQRPSLMSMEDTTDTQLTDMSGTERGLPRLSQRPNLMSMEDTTQLTDTMDTERGLLRLSQRPSLMSMEDTTLLTDTTARERGRPRLSRRPNLITREDTTDTLLTDTTFMESRQLPFRLQTIQTFSAKSVHVQLGFQWAKILSWVFTIHLILRNFWN